MRLTKIALERTREAYAPLPAIGELLAKADRSQYYSYIWEPQNRATFARHDFDECASRDSFPLPVEADRDHYFEGRAIEYWVSGLTDYLRIRDILDTCDRPHRGITYLDMGCCSGRVLRHVAIQDPASDAFGCDLNGQTIHWIHRYLPVATAFQSYALPHLPFADNMFDCVTAYSVFTHIDEFEEAWLMELRRILKPGGLALISNHGDAVWQEIHPEHFIYKRLQQHDARNELAITPELFQGPIPNERLAYYTGDGEANRVNLFRSDAHVREHWSKFLPVHSIVHRGHLFQDLVVLQKEGPL